MQADALLCHPFLLMPDLILNDAYNVLMQDVDAAG